MTLQTNYILFHKKAKELNEFEYYNFSKLINILISDAEAELAEVQEEIQELKQKKQTLSKKFASLNGSSNKSHIIKSYSKWVKNWQV